MALRIVFMGTPEFAVPSLDALRRHGYEIAGVVTATDKMGGRGKRHLIESAVKKYALKHDLHVLQPPNLKKHEFLDTLKSLQADLQVVVAFRMLPEVVWNMPSMGTMNLHGSLLPRYRGAAPINWAVMSGDSTTGVTTFLLKHQIDTGDVLLQWPMPIGHDETAGNVHDRMMYLGADVVVESVRSLESGPIELVPQLDSQATKAPKLFHEMCKINFNQPTNLVYNFIRGLSPYPTAWTLLDEQQFNIIECTPQLMAIQKEPGSVTTNQKDRLSIATSDGEISVLKMQLAGRRKMAVREFLNGYRIAR